MSCWYFFFFLNPLFTLSSNGAVGGTSAAVSVFFPLFCGLHPPRLSPFPGPLLPFFLMQTVSSRIQTEEMFSSCFLKGVGCLAASPSSLGASEPQSPTIWFPLQRPGSKALFSPPPPQIRKFSSAAFTLCALLSPFLPEA